MANNSSSSEEDDFYVEEWEVKEGGWAILHTWKFVAAILMCLCCLGGLCGDTISSFIFLHRSMRSSPINFLLAAVSMIDLVVLILIIPMLILPGMNFYFQYPWIYQFYLHCVLIAYPVVLMSQTASTWTYVLVVVERYVAVCQPLKTYKLLTMSQAKKAQSIIILASIAYNVIRFFEYRRTADGHVEEYLRANKFYFLFYYASLHLASHFLIPLSIIAVLNFRIIHALTSSRNRQLPLRRCGANLALTSRRQTRTAWMIVVATGAFVLTNTLTFFVNLWEAVEPGVMRGEGRWSTTVHAISDLANILLTSHSACTFIIYTLFCRQYRSLFRRMVLQAKGHVMAVWSRRCEGTGRMDWQRLRLFQMVDPTYSPTEDGEGRVSVYRTRTFSTVVSNLLRVDSQEARKQKISQEEDQNTVFV